MEIKTLVAAINQINDRVIKLEKTIEAMQGKQPQATPIAPPKPTSATPPPPTSMPNNISTGAPTMPSLSSNLLGLIAVLCFVLAAIYLVKLGVESGWFTPAKQLVSIYLLGVGLVGAGTAMAKRDNQYADFARAPGTIILYIASMSSHLYFGILAPEAAGLSAVLVSILSIYLFYTGGGNLYGLLATSGTYLTPFFLGFYREYFQEVLIYFIVWGLTFAWIGYRFNNRFVSIVSSYFSVASISFMARSHLSNTIMWSFVIALFAQFLLTLSSVIVHTIKKRQPLTHTEALAFLPLLLLFYSSQYRLFAPHVGNGAAWISVGLGVLLYGAYAFAKNKVETTTSSWVVMFFWALVIGHSIYLELIPYNYRVYFAILIMALGAVFRGKISNTPWYSHPVKIVLLAIVAIESMFLFSTNWMIAQPEWPTVVEFAQTLALVAGAFLHFSLSSSKQRGGLLFLLTYAHVMMISALYRITVDHGSLEVSLAWLTYGVVVLIFSLVKKERLLGQSSLMVLVAAAAKALLYDTANSAPIVRIGCLLITGALLYLAGFLYRKIQQMTSSD